MAITDTLTNISNLIKDMTLTRADINMSNLSASGKSQLAEFAGGIPWSVTSNVLTKVENLTCVTDVDAGTATFGGSVTALIPNGRSVLQPGKCENTEANITISTTPVSVTFPLDKPKAVVVDTTGAVQIVNYVVSYSAPLGAVSGDMWYDLTANILRFYENDWTQFNGVKIGSLKYDSKNELVFTGAGTIQIPDFDTVLTEIELAKAPVGTVIAYMGTDEPEGYLLMDGRELSRTTYSRLFSVIGTTQGEGDGSTTFNIADMTDGRYLMGSTVAGGSRINAGVPDITGAFMTMVATAYSHTGAFTMTYLSESHRGYNSGDTSTDNIKVSFSAKSVNNLYGSSTTVTPTSYASTFLIRY